MSVKWRKGVAFYVPGEVKMGDSNVRRGQERCALNAHRARKYVATSGAAGSPSGAGAGR